MTALLSLLATVTSVQDAARYVDEKRVVTDVGPEAGELREILAGTVRRVLEAGHLGPYYTSRGEGSAHWYFKNPGDLVGALSAAFPHLPEPMKPKTAAYLRAEMKAYPPWTDVMLKNSDPDTARRNLHPLPDPDFLFDAKRAWPRLHNVYALWRYADATGDAEFLRGHAKAVAEFYRKHRSEAPLTYGEMSGPIGMARLARTWGDAALEKEAGEDLRKALERGKDPAAMLEPSWGAYRLGRNAKDEFNLHAFFALHLAPETARFVKDHPDVRRAAQAFIDEGTYRYPMWFVSQASCFMRLYGESHAITPLYSKMVFPWKALVEEAEPDRLRVWVDAEDAPVGDLFFIERLVLAIEARGRAAWVPWDR